MGRTATKIKLELGSIMDGSRQYLPGETLEVDAETLSHLEAARGPVLQFVVVKDGPKKAAPSTDEDAGLGTDEQTQEDEQSPDQTETTGEGEELGEDEEVPPAPPAPPAAPATALGLQSIDAKVEAALAEAGYLTRESVQAATVQELVKVKGIGKARAEAILAELAG